MVKSEKFAPAKFTRGLFLLSGLSCLVMAGIGAILPGWPVTIFCILALYCFKRSSLKLETWLLEHRIVGPTLRDWDENKWMTLRAKRIAISLMWLSMIATAALVPKPKLWFILAACGVGVSWYILTRRTKPELRVTDLQVLEPDAEGRILPEAVSS